MKTPFVRRAVVALLGLLSCAPLAFAQSAVQTVIINDTLADGERAIASLPESAQWFSSSSASTLTVTNETLAFSTLSTAGRHALAHFPAKTLALGESLELSFDFQTSAGFVDQASGLRFGLFSTNGAAAVVADGTNNGLTYIGYAVTTNGNPTAGGNNPTVLRKRSSTPNQLLTSTGSYTSVGNTGGVFAAFVAGVTYRATLTIERLEGDTARLTVRYTGGTLPTYTLTAVDTLPAVTTFDTLAIAIGSSNSVAATTQFAMDNVSVIHIGPTPAAITTEPSSVTVPHGEAAFFTVGASGSAPLTYQWHRNGEILQGQTTSTLWFQSVTPADAGDYTVVVTNAANVATSVPATLTVDTTPVVPSVRTQPLSQTVVSGGSARFAVAAKGTPPYSYQWQRNGVPLPGATSNTLQLANVSANQAGYYSVVISNGAGSVTSEAAVLTVTPGLTTTVRLNDTFADGNILNQLLPDTAHWYSSSTSSTGNLVHQSGALLVPAGRHALAYFTDGAAQSLAVGDEIAATFTVNFSALGNSAGGLRLGLFNSNGETRATDGDNLTFTKYDGFMATTTVRFPDSDSSSSGSLSLMRRTPDVGGALLSTVGNFAALKSFSGNNISFEAGVNYAFKVAIVRTADAKLRFTFTATGGSLVAYGYEEEFDSVVNAFDCFAILSTSANGSTFTLDDVVITHTAAPAAVLPTILMQPQSASVNPGESVTFSADATGTPVPTFQWRKGGVAIEGATGASYTIAAAAAGDAGDYDVVVTNSAGSATSNVAVLTVASPLSALQTWRVTYFGAPEATGDAADLADPDADGLVNLVEYALGFDPKEADVAALPATASADGQWVFNYTRPVDRSDLTYTVQVSTNLQTWTTVAQEQAAVVGDTATWRAVYPQAGNPNAFFRLSVSLNAP